MSSVAIRTGPDHDVMLIERGGGWPAAAGRIFLALTALAFAMAVLAPHPQFKKEFHWPLFWVQITVLLLLSAIVLLRWRRGTIINLASATMTRWWGLAGRRRPFIWRQMPPRSLAGFTGVRVLRSSETEHYKSFKHAVYHVQLEKSESGAGQLTLRERIIVDDEIPDPVEAARTGRRLAEFLSLDLIDRTAIAS